VAGPFFCDFHGPKERLLCKRPIGGTLAKCDPFGISSTSYWTGAAMIEQASGPRARAPELVIAQFSGELELAPGILESELMMVAGCVTFKWFVAILFLSAARIEAKIVRDMGVEGQTVVIKGPSLRP